MLVGEIGIQRREYLYEMTFCEILLTIRGYFRRYHPGWEQARLIAYQVHYCMGVAQGQTAKSLEEFIPFPWDHQESDAQSDLPTEEDIAELRRIMAEENARFEQSAKADS